MTQIKIFGREPALWIAFVAAIAMALAGLHLPWLNAGESTAIVAALAAALMAATTRPIGPGVFVSAFAGLAAVFAEYGLPLSEPMVTAVGGVIMAGFALLGIRPQATPAADPRPIGGHPLP
jgi:hypothetical protein